MIGILGGTFDPIHYGHLRTALDVQQALGLDELRFIPLANAVHRDQPEVPAALRLAMLEAAIAGEPGFVADDRELQRGGVPIPSIRCSRCGENWGMSCRSVCCWAATPSMVFSPGICRSWWRSWPIWW
ncbi:nicotinate-nicotinamide nucleotide adenylyltransferase [endosymbiont of Tevnia jerichonana]|uniref:nicotinate-nucleotide adenylyltransferase n=1 Tax=endosymbiont of Tevnia jerichonana (vent Tica) TaxID=1049564 RepID=G2FIU8_9GAMM|nr:nicotinate-nucleotide adenylyltransferase [endosymbiont of Tevnia jerichonana (vent Tica)]